MDPEDILAALGPVLGVERAARLDAAAAARLWGVTVVLENLHDPHNGGAALRSIEGVGLAEVHLVEAREPFRFSERVTQGCEKWLELHRHRTIDACVAALKARGFTLYAAVPGAPTALEEIDPLAPAAFLIGNEHEGLSAAAQASCQRPFAIPLAGFSQSVNLSVATALISYTHARRRRLALGRPGDLLPDQLARMRARYYQLSVRGADAIVARHLGRSR
jgi:tRNA (guanosine-2'-O-)-methyltransferase